MDSTARPGGRTTVPLRHGGLDRPYLLQAPSGTAGERVPLVLELHGHGIAAARFDRMTGFGELAGEGGFVLAMPGAAAELWNDGSIAPTSSGRVDVDDVGYLEAVIGDVSGRADIDPRRVYVFGMSNGATMAARLACQLPGRIAAIAQVAGTAAPDVAGRCGVRPMPVLNIHGSADDYAPYDGGGGHDPDGRAALSHAVWPVMAVDDWAALWVRTNGASETPAVSELAPDTSIRSWSGTTPRSDVVFYRVAGGGHTWPGGRWALPRSVFGRTTRTFDAAAVIWDFLSAHQR